MQPERGPRLLVVGYGSTLRGDDGVGPRVAEAVAEKGWPEVEVLVQTLLTPEIAHPLARTEAVVFVDAILQEVEAVNLTPLSACASVQLLGHEAKPETLLALARDVYGHAPRAWLLTIPVSTFDIGERLSAKAQAGVAAAVREIERLVAAL